MSAKFRKYGRNFSGNKTTKNKGNGVKRNYQKINWNIFPGDFIVEKINYDPNRSAPTLKIKNMKGEQFTILAVTQIKPGFYSRVDGSFNQKQGQKLLLKNIPTGTSISCIQIKNNQKPKLVRAASTFAVLLSKDEKNALVKLPSGKKKLIPLECTATIGNIADSLKRSTFKAGQSRRLGKRPKVRGLAMNPCDHPHGGGKGGKHSIGCKTPKTRWGKFAFKKY